MNDDYSLDKINEIVLTHELTNKACLFCEKMEGFLIIKFLSNNIPLGFQINCCKNDCNMTAHLLCAYLNGIYFSVKISNDFKICDKEDIKQLRIQMFCNSHSPHPV